MEFKGSYDLDYFGVIYYWMKYTLHLDLMQAFWPSSRNRIHKVVSAFQVAEK